MIADSPSTAPPDAQSPRVTRFPQVTYTKEHHRILDIVHTGWVTVHADNYHLIAGIRVHDDVEPGFAWLLMGGHTELDAEPDDEGERLVLLTPLGEGVLGRWNLEQGIGGEL